ncbi:MAG TPA: SDR family oxidoreductase [Verrucomicrobiae bacterium]|nr:SDR family oxidoreductase [Verrucomicrobiae bacterium]
MYSKRTALVTGSSSGIGFETALLLAKKGFYTFATARNPEKFAELKEIANKSNLPLELLFLDVNDENSIKKVVNIIMEKNRQIDIVINNAGYGASGALEDFSIDEIKSLFETNFFGALRVIQTVLPFMRMQKNGIIVNISSIGGRIPFPFSSAYASTKFALEGLSEALQYEVEQFGIKIILIEPGIIKTNFLENAKRAKKSLNPGSPYNDLLQKRINKIKIMFENGTSPDEVAKVILNAITSNNEPDLRYVVGNDANSLLEKRKSMSEREFLKTIHKNVFESN